LADAIRHRRLLWLLVPLLLGIVAAPAAAYILPPGFQGRVLPLPKASSPTYVNGLQNPSTLDFAPDGTMFVAERNGRVLAFDSIEDSTPTLTASILDEVHATGDRGILGMKLDPEYPDDPYIYLSYTYDAPIGGDSDDSTHPHLADGSDDCDTSNDFGCLVSGRLARIEINPTTDVAVGGPEEPPQEVLINSWCQQSISHSIGDLEFVGDGALLMSGGDGASYNTPDIGQLSNACQDPANEGGALRSQDVRTPATASDPTDYNGSLIRVDPDTAAALPENPFVVDPLFNATDEEDVAAGRIIAYGLRNPFRFTLQPGSDRVYVGDVGWDRWEEIDELRLPPQEQGAVNFGWPCYEGGPSESLVQPRYVRWEKPLCESLYGTPGGVRAPLFAYPHSNTPGYEGWLFPGDECAPWAGSAIAGLAFYDPTVGNPSVAFPGEYDGALFFTDAARGCIWTIREGTDGRPDPATVENFWVRQGSDPTFTPVDVVQGPDNALYVPSFHSNEIVQIRYLPDNQVPTAAVAADKTFGALDLKVKFDATGSSDPDPEDQLHFAWDLDGDGQFDDGTAPKAERTYTESENVTARVRVKDDLNHSDVASIDLYPGDEGPPDISIVKPNSNLEWAIGDSLEYEATATDPDGEELGSGPGTLTPHWEFILEHCPSACHDHPLTSSDTPSGHFPIPPHEYPSHLRLEFTATDSRGLSATKSVQVYPRLIEVSVNSRPAGLPLTLDGTTVTNPFTATTIAGGSINVSAPEEATLDGKLYVFSKWSDNGARVHDVTSLSSTNLVADFSSAVQEEPVSGPLSAGGLLSEPPRPAGVLTDVQLRLASRPPGVRLRLGALSARAPFSAELAPGSKTFLLAPRSIRRGGDLLRFRRWSGPSLTSKALRRQPLTVSGDGRYVAVYGRR
jgi:glucose/arabinose dehydrogenase